MKMLPFFCALLFLVSCGERYENKDFVREDVKTIILGNKVNGMDAIVTYYVIKLDGNEYYACYAHNNNYILCLKLPSPSKEEIYGIKDSL